MVSIENLAFWTAIATWGLATGTLIILFWQTYLQRRLNSANVVMELRERFDSPRMRRARRTMATQLLQEEVGDIASLEVATFFELIGAQTARRVLDLDMIWEAFGSWVTSYYTAMRAPIDYIGRFRDSTKDPLFLYKFEWLNDQILLMDRRLLGPAFEASHQAVEEERSLLRREATLDLE